jgi:hypothetical protein
MIIVQFTCKLLCAIPVREISVAARLARPGCSAELFETTASAGAARRLGLPTWPGRRTVGVPAISRLPAPAGAAG